MIRPPSFKYQCSVCGYRKLVRPKGDVLSENIMFDLCPKCGTQMKIKKLNRLEQMVSRILSI